MDTNQKGDIAEAKAVARFMELGYTVSEPINDHSRYDLVVEKDGLLNKVQVKYAAMSDGKIKVSISSSNPNTKGTVDKIYSSDEVDAYAVYCPATEDLYWIDFVDAPDNSMSLRVEADSSHPSINWAKDYRI